MKHTIRGITLGMMVAGTALTATSAKAQTAFEVRGGINVPTFKVRDAVKAGGSFGVGLHSQIGARTWLMADIDMGMHGGADLIAGLTGPDIDVTHLLAKVGYQVNTPGYGVAIVLNAGAGAMRFKVDGGKSYLYPAINVGAKLIYPLGKASSFVVSPQGDIAFSKKSEVGTTNSWIWPFAAGFRLTF